MQKNKKTEIQKFMSEIGKKGGKATAKKYGKTHFRDLALKRHKIASEAGKALKGTKSRTTPTKRKEGAKSLK